MKCSVVIPAHNAAATLPAALESCLAQTAPPAEILVVDDGSEDGTAEVAAGAGVRCERVTQGGVSRARNIGARLAAGDTLLFLDADDRLLPHALDVLGRCLVATGAGMAYGMVLERRAPPREPRLNGFAYAAGAPPAPAERNFWRSAVVTPGSALVRAELHREIGGFVSGFEPMEDRDYWVKCGLLAAAAFCDTVVLDKAWSAGSHGSQHAKRIYRGQLAQRALRGWCIGSGLDASWIPSDAEILRRALDEALWRREFAILSPLRAAARGAALRHWRSCVAALVARCRPPPAWIREEPRVCDE